MVPFVYRNRNPARLFLAVFFLTSGCNLPAGGDTSSDKPIAKSYRTNAQVESLAYSEPYLWVGLTNGIVRYDTRTEKETITYTNWSTHNAFLSNGIYAIEVDRQGGLWVGTFGGGLSRFDGKEWLTYTPYGWGKTDYGPTWAKYEPGSGLGDLWVYDIAFDRTGTAWIATWKGASRFDGKTFHTYGEADGVVDQWVYAITFDRDGTIWFGTEAGVSHWDGQHFTNFTHADGIGRMLEAEQNPAIETYGTASRHHSTMVKDFTKPNPNYILSALTDHKNRKWFGTWGAGLSVYDGKGWKTYTTQDGLGGNWVNALAMGKDNQIWAGTNAGLSRFDGKHWMTYTQQDGLLDPRVYAIEMDPAGNIWVGTKQGVTRLFLPKQSFLRSLAIRLGLKSQ